LNFNYKDSVPQEELVSSLVPVLTFFKHGRHDGETLGDFCHRVGQETLQMFAEEYALEMSGSGAA